MEWAAHGSDSSGNRRRDVGSGRCADAGGEGGGVQAVLGGNNEVRVDSLDMTGIRLSPPTDHESFDDRIRLIDICLRDHRLPQTTRRLRDERQRHHRHVSEILPRGVVIDIQDRLQTPGGSEHGDSRLNVHANITGMNRYREWFRRRYPRVELTVNQQTPDIAEGHPANEVGDINTAVPQGAALAIGLGNLCLEGDDTLQARDELSHFFLLNRGPYSTLTIP